jgi:ADP-glucose pyrophosphorylase
MTQPTASFRAFLDINMSKTIVVQGNIIQGTVPQKLIERRVYVRHQARWTDMLVSHATGILC